MNSTPSDPLPATQPVTSLPSAATQPPAAPAPEIGGRDGPEPTRFGDWELRGRCVDF